MSPKEVIQMWVDAFNAADADGLADTYDENAINYQEANAPIKGKQAIKKVFQEDFKGERITCVTENIFEDGQWAILEWSSPQGLRGCDFFQIERGKIVLQKAYWDKSSL